MVDKSKKNKDEESALSGQPMKDHKVIDHPEKHRSGGDLIKSAVYGGLDGMITTFSVVMAAAGSGLNPIVVLAMGVANLIGDGLSMGLGDWLSTKTAHDWYK